MSGRLRAYLTRWSRSGVVQLRGHDAFISYSHSDALPYARALWEGLENEGLTVFLDERDLEAGDPLSESLKKKIQGAQDLILLATPVAAASRYVIEEVGTAISSRRNIIKIRFTCLETECVWPHESFLGDRIWIDESGLPDQPPSPAVIDRVLGAHGARRKRRQVMTVATLTIAMLAATLAVIALSVTARRQADTALAKFLDPAIGLADARQNADSVLEGPMFWLFDWFANKQHWQLRDLVSTTHLKVQSAGLDIRPVPAGCATTSSLAPCLSESPSWRIQKTSGDTDSAELVAISRDGAFTNRFDVTLLPTEALTTKDVVATRIGTIVELWRLHSKEAADAEKYATLDIGEIKAWAFSPDARQLSLLSRSDNLNAWALNLVDVGSGTVIQAASLAGSQNGGTAVRCRNDEYWIASAGQTVLVCSQGGSYSFDVLAPPNLPTYEMDFETRNSRVIGGDFTSDGAIAYWLQTGKVYLCVPVCSIALTEKQAGDDIQRLSLAKHPSGLYDLLLTKNGNRRVLWRCRIGHPISCTETAREVSPSTALAVSTHGTTIEMDGLNRIVVRAADGTIVGSPSHEAFMRPGMSPTASAFADTGTIVAVALRSGETSLIAIGEQSFTGRLNWNALTTGHVLAIQFSDDGRRLTALENRKAVLVKRTYSYRPAGRADATSPDSFN